jgi:exodeoxyribonuclease VII large subunit
MGKGDENPGADSQTLAGLWLKSSPSPPRPRELVEGATGQSQMGLLFPAPSPKATSPPPPRSLRATPALDETSPSPDQARFHSTSPQSRPPTPPPSRERRIWTVRALVTQIRQHVETGYADVWVHGEISNCRPAPSGHIYFTLKDGEAQLSVVLFRLPAQLLRFRPQDGLAVLVRGRISVYESRGQLQLIADTMEPRGAGALQLAYEQLKARLLAEGLFDAARKRPLPAFPRTVGVVTSTGGAVLHDILNVIRRRHARLNLLVYPAPMQGPDCAAAVVAGIRYFNQPQLVPPRPGNRRRPNQPVPAQQTAQPDLILIARGGGSLEDLAGFNDETLARAIAASNLPIVSAIGHETDFTIADFVADLRAPTPSAAAELITAAQHRIEERIQTLDARVGRAIRYQLILARQRLTALSIAAIQGRLQALIGRRTQRLDDLERRTQLATSRRVRNASIRLAALTERLERRSPTLRLAAARRRLESANLCLQQRISANIVSTRATRLNQASARLEALSPLAVLSRGYALIYAPDGQLLRNAADTQPGQTIRARLASGALEAEVLTIRQST